MEMSLEFRELAKRIRAATDKTTLQRLEISCHRIYSVGLMTPKEFGRLDTLIMERLALL
jgi:hypothetical protein